MNEEAQKVLADLINKAVSGVDAAVEFSKQEIPIVIEQLLMWHFWEAMIYSLIGVAMVVGYFWIFKKLKKIAAAERESSGEAFATCLIGGIGSSVYFLIAVCFLENSLTSLKIYVAPKLYLLEYGTDLVQKIN